MPFLSIALVIFLFACVCYGVGFYRSVRLWRSVPRGLLANQPHSTPVYHGLFLSFWGLVWLGAGTGLALVIGTPSYGWMVGGGVFGLFGIFSGLFFLSFTFRARLVVERCVLGLLFLAACVAMMTTVGILLSITTETLRFFSSVSPVDFLFGLRWSPQTALRPDQVGSSGSFGIIPLLMGTGIIVFVAMAVAGPLGLLCAIFFSEYAHPKFRSIAKPLLEILAGIPTVVFGFFAAIIVAPTFRDWGLSVGLDISAQSALSAGLVMGIMIIPFISSLSDDVLNAVPQSLRDASYALGATQAETVQRVVLPAALPGIVSAFILALSRAIGETMIVVMAAGMAANLTLNPLESVTTVTVQINALLVGDQEFDSPKTLAAFALGFVLFFMTLLLNIFAMRIVKRYREIYE